VEDEARGNVASMHILNQLAVCDCLTFQRAHNEKSVHESFRMTNRDLSL
jgi:hypothetical protein